MKSGYTLAIMSKSFRPLYNSRYYIFKRTPYKLILSTDSLYEVKMWLDLRGLKFNRWKQQEYHFNIGTNKFHLMSTIEFESLVTSI